MADDLALLGIGASMAAVIGVKALLLIQWFTGNIGFHHIHHLSPRIPNYHLQRCHDADPFFKKIKPVTLLASFRLVTFRLWDERRNRFVGFRHLQSG